MPDKLYRSVPTRQEWLRMLAPTAAVIVGMGLLRSGIAAILLYHAQVLLWRPRLREAIRPTRRVPGSMALAMGFAAAGPLLYLLAPRLLPHDAIPGWLGRYGIGSAKMLWLIPYFGLVHPLFEELHWHDLRRQGLWAHGTFAAYHLMVLAGLLPPLLLLATGVALATASWLWAVITERTGSLRFAIAAHSLADLGIVVAAARIAGIL